MNEHQSKDVESGPDHQACSNRKKFEIIRVPSHQAIERTAPNAHFFDSVKTLFRWKESIYKLVWGHFVVYYVLYISLTVVYEFLLNETGRRHFEALTRYFSKGASTLNLMIMLGFFTSTTLQRLFAMQTATTGTAKIISSFIMSLKLDLPEGNIIVIQYARWAVLSWILAIRMVSTKMRGLYPDMISLEKKEILQPQERLILLQLAEKETDRELTPRPLIVIDWMLLLLKECFEYGRYNNKSSHQKNVENLMAFKKSCGNMIKFATKNVPNAIIQAVIIAVYYFGLVTMLARDLAAPLSESSIPHQQQNIPHQGDGIRESQDSVPKSQDSLRPDHDEIVRNIILYFPIMPLMQFFIFFAWLTFGRMAVNPFGEDETDIDLESLLNSHIDDYKRLGTLYTQKLEDLFPDLPQKRFFDAVLSPKDNDATISKDLESTNAPDFPIVPVPQSESKVFRNSSSQAALNPCLFSGLPVASKDDSESFELTPLVSDKNTIAITME